MFSRRARAFIKIISLRFEKSLGLLLRIAFCFSVGVVVFYTTRGTDYDMRFSLRGPQAVGHDVVLIQLTKDDVALIGGLGEQLSNNIMWSLKEIIETSDSFFWHPAIWEKTISQVLKGNPRAIVVTLFFGDETVRGTMTPSQIKLFSRPDIFWTSKVDSDGHSVLSGLATTDNRNTGVLELRSDPDGRVRHFLTTSHILPHLSVRVQSYLANEHTLDATHLGEPINFQGPRGTFHSIPFSDLLKNRIDPDFFRDKVVIFSAKDIPSHQVQTSLGTMSSGELLANLVYEFGHNKEIRKIPTWICILYLLGVSLITLWLVFEYPQSVALVFLLFFTGGILALSAALFDVKTLWLPAGAPLATLVATYVVISGYRLSESEKLSWESERELHYLSEVESLKNNFLSLISHDLKNPLAKIQGITDRLLACSDTQLGPIKDDLQTIQHTSEELRQYIGSLLQLTRVEARNIKLTKEVCDINNIVEEVVERVHLLASQKNIQIKQNLEPIFSIEVDRSLISEVLLNLVENAIKYSDEGGIIKVTTQEINNEVRVEITDNGAGIAEADIPKVFEKFFRGSGQKTLQVTGTGLGLYLVKYFIELHGGKVFITSRVGEGTKAGFVLPLDSSEENYAEFTRPRRG